MTDVDLDALLWAESHGFAQRLNYLMSGVLPGDIPLFRAEETPKGLVAVSTEDPFTLYRAGQATEFGFLDAALHCVWSSQKPIMAVTKSVFKLRGPGGGIPVLHMDYRRDMKSKAAPVSHYNVSSQHPILQAMADPEGKAISESQKAEATRRLHLPTGGHRFRPSLEDLLTMLICDLGIDAQPNWQVAVNESRGIFREMQTGAAVRDHPDKAVQELRRMGYNVEWGGDSADDPSSKIREHQFYRY